MRKNIWRKQKGFTLLELLLAFAIFAIFIPAFISFARTAISNNNRIQNQTNATNQLKNAFNYITQDGQMAGLVIVNPPVPPAPANCVLKLQWINYPSDTIEADYTLLNGVLTRIYTDSQDSTKNGSMVVATNVNPDTAKTYFNWSGTSLTIKLTVTIANANEVRQFSVTPRVTQSSSQLSDTLNLAMPNPSPASYGSTVTLTANFNPSSVKSGTVTFLDSNSAIPIGTAPVLTGGTAACSVSTLSVGNHTISAVFSGDAVYATSTSNTQSLTINQATTSTVVTASPTSGPIGQQFVFSVATLPSGATGNVTFTSNISGDGMNIIVPVSGGTAVTAPVTLSSTSGVHIITATYSGDIDYAGSYGTVPVTILYPDPVLNSISPTSCSVTPGAAVPLTANGSQFVVNISQVWFGATQLTVTSWTANQMIASIPTSLLTAASSGVSVVVKTPGATNPSGAKTFKIIGPASAAMSQLTVSPVTNIKPDGVTTATLIVTAIDSVGNNVPTGGATVKITCLSGTCTLTPVPPASAIDNGNGTYKATVTSTSTGLCVFVATLGGSTVNNGGGSQAQVTVAFVAGNTIYVTSNTNWSALTGGTGTLGLPGSTDLVIVSNAATLTVDTSSAVANTVVLGNSSSSGNLKFNSGLNSTLTVNTVRAGYSSSCDVDMTNGGILVVTNQMTTGLVLTPGTGSINFGGAGNQTLPSDITTYYNLATVGTVTLTTSAATVVSGTLSVSDGTTFNAAAYNLTVNGATKVGNSSGSGTSGTLSLTSVTGTKIFKGLVTIYAGGVWNNSISEAVEFTGGITNNGTFTAGSAVQTFDTSSQTLTGNLSIPSVTVTGITLTNNGILTVTTALVGTGGTLSNAGTLNLNFSGSVGITALDATVSGNTVNYQYTGDQTVFGTTYSNLILSGSGVKTINTAKNGTLTTGIFSIDPTGSATASITKTNVKVYTLVIVGSTKSVGTWGYGPSNPPANKDTTHFANTTGYVTSSH